MTRNISGVSASRASRAAESAPLLRVVTADGAVTIPSVVLERSAERALADYSAGLRAKVELAASAANTYDLAMLAANTYDTGRAAIAAPAGQPERPATPCPAWCVVGEEHEDGDRSHYSQARRFVGFSAHLDIDDQDTLTLEVSADRPERANLDLTEVDELIAGLTRTRAELADALRARRLVVLAGGAA